MADRWPSLTAAEPRDLLGPDAEGWPGLGLRVTRGGVLHSQQEQVKVWHDRELVGYTKDSDESPGQRAYVPVAHVDYEGLPYGRALPPGVVPQDPLRAHEEAKQRSERR